MRERDGGGKRKFGSSRRIKKGNGKDERKGKGDKVAGPTKWGGVGLRKVREEGACVAHLLLLPIPNTLSRSFSLSLSSSLINDLIYRMKVKRN